MVAPDGRLRTPASSTASGSSTCPTGSPVRWRRCCSPRRAPTSSPSSRRVARPTGHRRLPHLDAQQAQRRPRPRPADDRARSTRCSPPPTSWCTTTVRRVAASSASTTTHWPSADPATHRLVGAVVAGQPPRRRPPGRRAARAGPPRRPRRAAGLPRTVRSSSAARSASWCASHLAAIGIVARLIARQRTGHAGPAHTSVAQGALVPMAMHWRRVEHPSPSLAIGHAQGADRGDAVRVRRRRVDPPDGRPHEVADVHRGDRGGAARRSAPGPRHAASRQSDGWAEALLLHPSGEWLESFWANDVPVQPAAAARRDLRRRAGAHERLRHRGRPSRARPDHDGGLTGHGHARRRACVVRAGTRRAHRRGARRVGAAPHAGSDPDRDRPEHPLAARGVQVVDTGAFLAGPLGPMLLRRPRRRRGEGRAAGRRGHALGRVVVLRLPARQARRRPRPQVARRARPALDALLARADILHHNLRMPAAAPSRPRRGDRSARSTPTSSTATPAPTARSGAARRLARLRPALPVVVRLGGRGRAARATRRCGTGSASWTTMCAMGSLDLHAARARTTATAPARRQFVAGSLLGGGVMTNSETYLDADGELVPIPALDHEQTGTLARLPHRDGGRRLDRDRRAPPTSSSRRLHGSARRRRGRGRRRRALGADDGRRSTRSPPPACRAKQVRLDQGSRSSRRPTTTPRADRRGTEHVDYGDVEQPGAFWIFGDLDVQPRPRAAGTRRAHRRGAHRSRPRPRDRRRAARRRARRTHGRQPGA